MLYEKTTRGPVLDVCRRLEAAATENGFGVLGLHDLAAKMREKGIDFPRQCCVLEVCNAQQARRVLEDHMQIATVLPCRIAVYEDDDKVTVSTLRPRGLLQMFGYAELQPVAREVEDTLIRIIDTACANQGD